MDALFPALKCTALCILMIGLTSCEDVKQPEETEALAPSDPYEQRYLLYPGPQKRLHYYDNMFRRGHKEYSSSYGALPEQQPVPYATYISSYQPPQPSAPPPQQPYINSYQPPSYLPVLGGLGGAQLPIYGSLYGVTDDDNNRIDDSAYDRLPPYGSPSGSLRINDYGPVNNYPNVTYPAVTTTTTATTTTSAAGGGSTSSAAPAAAPAAAPSAVVFIQNH